MVVWAVRAAFILVIFGVGWAAIVAKEQPLGPYTWSLPATSLVIGVFVMIGDYLSPRKKLTIFAGGFFGLMAGIILAYALSFVAEPIVGQIAERNTQLFAGGAQGGTAKAFVQFVDLLIGTITCYLSVSFVLQTKDDFRFIVPYVEFSKQTKGNRPIILDTSALIDGRIADIAAAGIFDTQLIVPRFVLNELQQVADSADKLKRNRGRRGLDVLKRLQDNKSLDIVIQEASHLADVKETRVDQLLMVLATELHARVITTDFNLNKVAQVGGVDVINVNDLANALKAEVLPGERRQVHIERPGEQANQGVGYLDDGTYVVVEHGKQHVGEDVEIVVTNTRQTSAGKMIFGRVADDTAGEPPTEPRTDGPPRPGDPAPREPRRNGPNGGFSRSPRRGPPEPRA